MNKTDHFPNVAITGVSGYLGSNIATLFQQRGFVTYGLTSSQSQPSENNQLRIPFSLNKPPSADFFLKQEIKILIHCAYDFRPINQTEIKKINVDGSIDLMKSAKAGGIEKIIFISSMSAFDGCESLYGKAKLKIESEAQNFGAIIVRPGLIYSDKPGAMMGRLVNAVRFLPMLPNITGGEQKLYLAHMDDLLSLIFLLATTNDNHPNGPIIAACDQGKTMSDILETIAKSQNKRIITMPINWRFIWLVLKLLETAGIKLPFRSDSIVSLYKAKSKPDFLATRKTKIQFRDFH
jgi:nucleoside-diphosphate-sugar epimerase